MATLLVKEICKQKGISLKTLAELMGVSASAISQVINNPNPSLQSLQRIAKVLNVSLAELVDAEYKPLNGFVEVDGVVHTIKSREQWVNVTNQIQGLPHLTTFSGEDEHQRQIKLFCNACIKSKTSNRLMAWLGTDEIFNLLYDESADVFYLTTSRNSNVYKYDVFEYCGKEQKDNDIREMITEIINDVESVYHDKQFADKLKNQ